MPLAMPSAIGVNSTAVALFDRTLVSTAITRKSPERTTPADAPSIRLSEAEAIRRCPAGDFKRGGKRHRRAHQKENLPVERAAACRKKGIRSAASAQRRKSQPPRWERRRMPKQHDGRKDRHCDAGLARLRHRFGGMLEQQQVVISPKLLDRLIGPPISRCRLVPAGCRTGRARHAALALHAKHRNAELRSETGQLDGAPGIARARRDHGFGKMVVGSRRQLLRCVPRCPSSSLSARRARATAPWRRRAACR
jgi:hypothetical protein